MRRYLGSWGLWCYTVSCSITYISLFGYNLRDSLWSFISILLVSNCFTSWSFLRYLLFLSWSYSLWFIHNLLTDSAHISIHLFLLILYRYYKFMLNWHSKWRLIFLVCKFRFWGYISLNFLCVAFSWLRYSLASNYLCHVSGLNSI